MGKYSQDAQELLRQVGGVSNISAVTHCMTRMRFALKDQKAAHVDKIEQIPSVKGSFTQAGQFQVIIGNDVKDFYQDFLAVSGLEDGASKQDVKNAALEHQNIVQKAMGAVAEVFAPLIPAIIVGGLILGFRNVLGDMPYFGPDGNQTLASLSVFWTGVYNFLWLLGEAVFHTGIPVGICWSVTRKMGGTPMLGIVLGLTLISGQLLNAYAVSGATEEVWATHTWDFGFAQAYMIGYQAQVIPAILAAVCMNYYERFFNKITPEVIKMIVVPFCTLLLGVMTAHFIVGPIGWVLGDFVGKAVSAGISGSFRVVFGLIFGGFYAPLVITGLHHMTNAVDLQLIANTGGTMLWPMIALSNIAQGSAVLGMSYLQRKDERAQQINIPAIISCYLGVTEPAMFGVNLKFKFPFISAMIGSGIAGITCVGLSVTANAIGVGGLPGILSIQPPFIVSFAICMAIAVIVPFVLTVVIGKQRGVGELAPAPQVEFTPSEVDPAAEIALIEKNARPASDLVVDGTLKAPVSGSLLPLSEVDDQVFSQGTMGQGVAIEPISHVVCAPADATVSALMEKTGHAIGLTLPNGLEVLLHIGIDTVDMQGDGFVVHVTQGQHVKAGDPLISYDKDKVKAAGHKDTLMVVLTGEGEAKDISLHTQGDVVAGVTSVVDFS